MQCFQHRKHQRYLLLKVLDFLFTAQKLISDVVSLPDCFLVPAALSFVTSRRKTGKLQSTAGAFLVERLKTGHGFFICFLFKLPSIIILALRTVERELLVKALLNIPGHKKVSKRKFLKYFSFQITRHRDEM
jgi:hypothetical protein